MRASLVALAAVVFALSPQRASAVPGDLDPAFGDAGIATSAADVLFLERDAARDASGRYVLGGSRAGGFAVARFTSAGALDTGFGAGGVATAQFGVPAYEDRVEASAIQPDGAIVAVGVQDYGTTPGFALARFLDGGTLDPDFGSGGTVVTPLALPGAGHARTGALQADGKILVAGDAVLARYLTNGSLDPSFGSGGIIAIPVGAGPNSLALQSDQRIVVGGGTADGIGVARFTTGGALDPTFGDGGVTALHLSAGQTGLVVQSDDRIVLGLAVLRGKHGGAPNALGALRLTAAGALDPSFGDGGIASFPGGDPKHPDLAPRGRDFAAAVALDSKGKILLLGENARAATSASLLARLTSDGRLDGTFGARGDTLLGIRGKVTTAGFGANRLIIEPDDAVVAVGGYLGAAPGAIALARYLGACTNIACLSGPPLSDADADCECDAQDPCTNDGAHDLLAKPSPRLTLAKIASDPIASNDALERFSGAFDLPPAASFADLQSNVDGMRVAIEGSDRVRKVDVSLPGGAYAGAGTRGWMMSGKRWRYRDATAAPVNGIRKVVLVDRSKPALADRVEIQISAKDGSFPFVAADAPVHVSVALGGPAAAASGLCTESHFGDLDCAFNPSGNKLTCRK